MKKIKKTPWVTKYIRRLRRHEYMRKNAKTPQEYEFLAKHNCEKEKCSETLREVGLY